MSDRSYSTSFNQNKSAPAFQYIEDPTGGPSGSGEWRPMRTTDLGGGGGGSADFTATNRILVSGANSEAAASVTSSVNFTGSLLAKSAAGEIHSVFGYCSGAAQYLRMYDGTGTNGVLLGVIAVSAQNNFSVDYSAHGAKTTAGIFVAFSSSPSSHVATGPDGIITIVWK